MKSVKHSRALAGTISLPHLHTLAALQLLLLAPSIGFAQAYGQPDRAAPGDAMIQEYLRQATETIEADFLGGIKSAEDWSRARSQFRQEYFHMLGLWPLPEKTPLEATVTRTLDRGDYCVDLLHYQSRPGLYVTGNLYRPAKVGAGERLPAILYVCGHSPHGRDGNKTQESTTNSCRWRKPGCLPTLVFKRGNPKAWPNSER